MTPNIQKDKKELLDININELINTLRTLESDYDELDNTINDFVGYVIDNVLQRMYAYDESTMASAIGVLELAKLKFIHTNVLPKIKQSYYDSCVSDL